MNDALSRPPATGWHDGVEVLRGMAAVAVMLFHCIGLLPWDVAGSPLALFKAGWIGVDVFFVISGYVITGSARRLCGQTGGARAFWRARLARILPLYYMTSVVFLLLVSADAVREHAAFQVLTHALLIHNLFPETAFSINGVTWSLGVEMQLYLIAFLTVPLAAVLTRRRLVIGYVLILAGVVSYRLAAWHWLTLADASDAIISHAMSQVPALLDGFALGGLIALTGAPHPDKRRAVLLALLAFMLFLAIYIIFVENMAQYWQSMAMAVFFRSLVAAFAITALLAALSARARATYAWRPALRLGRISYGIYLWHLIVLSLVQAHLPVRDTLAVVVIVAVTLVLAEISWRLIERPCIDWARRSNEAERNERKVSADMAG